jgi:undecaprenyl-diphosphatase
MPALLVVIAVFVIVGEALTEWTSPNAVVELDRELADELVSGRTESRNDLAQWSSFPADTPIKIGLSLLVAGGLLWRLRRWHEAAFVGLTLIFEASAYLASSTIVARPRPDVERLIDSPVATSWPSGHVAAATVYGAVAVVVFWHFTARWARWLAVVVAALLPVLVGWSRMYQGMHFLSDVIAGIVLGVVSVAIGWWVLGSPHDAKTAERSLMADAVTGSER